eukprot:TRINITY_DN2987_c0_g1_i1.p1 TRINITY_DN2987_c0_g1~~TRINITY_DN2987_c0_g1_i1.p1  ORF type:complete len:220 (+),score=0.19 TRINITY_DN2987_c0_g1_i1:129-788(+)
MVRHMATSKQQGAYLAHRIEPRDRVHSHSCAANKASDSLSHLSPSTMHAKYKQFVPHKSLAYRGVIATYKYDYEVLYLWMYVSEDNKNACVTLHENLVTTQERFKSLTTQITACLVSLEFRISAGIQAWTSLGLAKVREWIWCMVLRECDFNGAAQAHTLVRPRLCTLRRTRCACPRYFHVVSARAERRLSLVLGSEREGQLQQCTQRTLRQTSRALPI